MRENERPAARLFTPCDIRQPIVKNQKTARVSHLFALATTGSPALSCQPKSMIRHAIFILSVFLYQSLQAALPGRSVSPSHQFIIYGGDTTLRGAVSALAEQTKANLLALLRQRDRWDTAIVINLQPQQANLPEIPPAELQFSQTGSGTKLQLDLTIDRNPEASLMERELLRAILLEMIYRNKPDIAPGVAFVEPPDWLLDGVFALTPGRDRAPLVEALSLSQKTISLEEFLRQNPALLDSTGRTLYRARSLALVQFLVDGMERRARLARYIDNLSNASRDPVSDLKAQFSSLAGDAEKIWQSTLAQAGRAQDLQLLTFVESDRRLDELLRVKIPNTEKSLDLSALAERKTSAAEKAALNELGRTFLLFIGQANPVLRPIAREYQQIAALLARGKRRGIAKRLERLQSTRQQLAARMSDVDDYMNWFEATQLPDRSGVFADYLKAANQPQTTGPRRQDPISVYLDMLEDQFGD
jgi:hypothetical protein